MFEKERTEANLLNAEAIKDGLMLPDVPDRRFKKMGMGLTPTEKQFYLAIYNATLIKGYASEQEILEIVRGVESAKYDNAGSWLWISRIRSKLGDLEIISKRGEDMYRSRRALIELRVKLSALGGN